MNRTPAVSAVPASIPDAGCKFTSWGTSQGGCEAAAWSEFGSQERISGDFQIGIDYIGEEISTFRRFSFSTLECSLPALGTKLKIVAVHH